MSGEGWRGRSQQIVMLKSKVKRLENSLHETQNRYFCTRFFRLYMFSVSNKSYAFLHSMTLGTINEESTLGPGMSTLNSNMSISTIGTNYTSKTTTRTDINGRPFDVDSKAGTSLHSCIELITLFSTFFSFIRFK